MTKNNGFTLIELMIVIAIIMILMALITPAIFQSQPVAELESAVFHLTETFELLETQ